MTNFHQLLMKRSLLHLYDSLFQLELRISKFVLKSNSILDQSKSFSIKTFEFVYQAKKRYQYVKSYFGVLLNFLKDVFDILCFLSILTLFSQFRHENKQPQIKTQNNAKMCE